PESPGGGSRGDPALGTGFGRIGRALPQGRAEVDDPGASTIARKRDRAGRDRPVAVMARATFGPVNLDVTKSRGREHRQMQKGPLVTVEAVQPREDEVS